MIPPNIDLDSAPLWHDLREHRLTLQACNTCTKRWFPRTPACPYCGSTDTGVVESEGHGFVYSYVGVNRALSDAMRDEAPYTIATVELDEGARLFARVEGGGVAIGDRVTPSFVDHDTWTELRFVKSPEILAVVRAHAAQPPRERRRQANKQARTAAIAGVGYTALTRDSGRSILSQATEACRTALDDAGLTGNDVDGMASFMVMHDSVHCQAVATSLAVPDLRFVVDADLGGQAPCYLTWLASMAIETGQADTIVIYRALNGRSGARVGGMQFHGPGGQYRYPIGFDHYMMYVAMWGQRFLHETGQGELDLAAVALSQREYALTNERAFRRKPLDLDTYLAQQHLVHPYRPDDCTVEVDGACAIVVTSVERARDLRHTPAVIASGAYRAGARSGLDIGDLLLWDDYTRNYTSWLRDDLFGRAGVTPSDVQIAEIYDCFTSTVLIGIEGLGLCERGASGQWVRDRTVPLNTHGGLLSEGYLHGMNTVCEAALQVQGRAGANQVPDHDVCVVTSGAMMDGSALILTTDR